MLYPPGIQSGIPHLLPSITDIPGRRSKPDPLDPRVKIRDLREWNTRPKSGVGSPGRRPHNPVVRTISTPACEFTRDVSGDPLDKTINPRLAPQSPSNTVCFPENNV